MTSLTLDIFIRQVDFKVETVDPGTQVIDFSIILNYHLRLIVVSCVSVNRRETSKQKSSFKPTSMFIITGNVQGKRTP